MEGLENDGATPPLTPGRVREAFVPRGELSSPGSDEREVDEELRAREALESAVAELSDSARKLRARNLDQERLLATCASELHSAARLLDGPDPLLRDDTVRRLRRLAEDLEGALRDASCEDPVDPLPRAPRPRLLLVDDEVDARDALAAALERSSEVATAADGQQALESARAERPDIILLDLNMPRLDGFETLEQLRADPATADIPVIVVSGQGDDAAKVRGLDLGAVDFMQKPFSARELRARVERTLRLLRSQTVLRELAQTDALTGLPNLRAFRARLGDEVKRARRYRTSLTCVMADLDQLKPINDLLGHAAGDRAIQAVAEVLRKELRETDFAARYGGDEFVILLPHTTAEEGRVFAQRASARLRATALRTGEHRLSVGASFGVACREPDAGDEPANALVERADAALYAAKRGGRGGVGLSSPASPL